MTSSWARWCLKSASSRLFAQPFVQAQIKKKHQSSTSLTFVRGIHRWPVDSPHKGPVTWIMFRIDDVIMTCFYHCSDVPVCRGSQWSGGSQKDGTYKFVAQCRRDYCDHNYHRCGCRPLLRVLRLICRCLWIRHYTAHFRYLPVIFLNEFRKYMGCFFMIS